MFERYTEKARRVIFFARYEASQYGSRYIETEHLLLGLLREDKALANCFLRSHGSIESLRKEIESRITIRKRTSTSVEVPLSQECKRILRHAADEADRLGHRDVSTEHLLLGILREEKSLAAQVLHKRGVHLSAAREWATQGGPHERLRGIREVVATMAEAWNRRDMEAFSVLFVEEAELVDVQGSLWKGRNKIAKAHAAIQSPPRQASEIKSTSTEIRFVRYDVALAHVVWEIIGESAEPRPSRIHTTLVLTEQHGNWVILSAQSTQVSPPQPAK